MAGPRQAHPTEADLVKALGVLRNGGVVACATETQFGLLADALDPEAVARVVDIKGRDGQQPIAVLLGDDSQLAAIASSPLTGQAAQLAAAHWPGPLTLIVRCRSGLPAGLVGDGTTGVRVPGPSPALELARAFGGPLTATSANRSGQPAALTPEQARSLIGVDFVVDVPAPGGPPSTIVDVTGDPPRILRQGAIEL